MYHAYEKDILHLDIKDLNILVFDADSDYPIYKLADFAFIYKPKNTSNKKQKKATHISVTGSII